MDYIRIRTITESDFDLIVADAGGTRLLEEDSADYLVHEAVVELKLVEEEGFDKESRQKKLAKIFRCQQPDAPVVVIDPESLEPGTARDYFNVVAGPIKTHVKKAASQLEKTRARYPDTSVSVLVLFNNGYSALSHDEFKSICLKCVRNDTSKVDWVIVEGMYFYSDKFDNYFITPFEAVAVNISAPFSSATALQEAWGRFIEDFMTKFVRGEISQTDGKMPVLDVEFAVEGTQFVKPAPKMGKSKFWPHGARPRENTAGFTSCPPVAQTAPFFAPEEWSKFKELYPAESFLCDSYRDWTDWLKTEDGNLDDPMKPLVPVPMTYDEFLEHTGKPFDQVWPSDLYEYAVELFDSRVRVLMEHAQDSDALDIIVPTYIHLAVREIGQDRANDMCSIHFVSEMLGMERRETILDNERMFFEHGLALASAYALKRNAGTVIYTKDQTHGWT